MSESDGRTRVCDVRTEAATFRSVLHILELFYITIKSKCTRHNSRCKLSYGPKVQGGARPKQGTFFLSL